VGRVLYQLILGLMDNDTPINNITISNMYIHGSLNILVEDAYLTVNLPKVSDIAWIDTALVIPHHRVVKQCTILTCSEHDRKQLERIGLKVSGVYPRPFNLLAYSLRNIPMEKEYDVFVCGWYREPDRKNFFETKTIIDQLNLKCISITNYPLPNRYDFAKVDDYTKYMLMKKSKYVLQLSGIEGFGLPPFEGMSVGIPVIYLDAPAINEFAVGFKIPVSHYVERPLPLLGFNSYCRYGKPNMREAVEIIKYAMELDRESYLDLSAKAMEKADTMQKKLLDYLHNIII
jgi:glycosyltransferase involved in cell wall biosynthesis